MTAALHRSARPPTTRAHLGSIAALTALLCLARATPAVADITAFIGANMTPSNRQTSGFAVGAGLLIVGFEFEYAHTSDDIDAAAPSLKTGTGNVLLQTPFAIHGVQPYFITGAGIYKESLAKQDDLGFTVSTGGGVKVSLAGPLRLRVDYRVFKLRSSALYSPAHRVYVGLNLKF